MAITVGPYRYKHITGKYYDMYYSPNLIIDCQKLPKGKWILTKKTKKGAYKLGSYKTRSQCKIAAKEELRISRPRRK